MRAFFPAWPGKQSRVISPNSIGGFTPFTPRSELQEIPVATPQESGVFFFPSRRGLTLWVSRECNPETLSAQQWNTRSWTQAQMRSILPCSDWRAIPSSNLQLEWNTGFSWRHTRGSLRSPWYFMRHPTLAPQLEKTHGIAKLDNIEFNRIRYLSAVLKNNLGDYKPKQKICQYFSDFFVNFNIFVAI